MEESCLNYTEETGQLATQVNKCKLYKDPEEEGKPWDLFYMKKLSEQQYELIYPAKVIRCDS